MNNLFNYDPISDGYLKLITKDFAVCMNEKDRWENYIFFKHPDGQWVSLRKLENFEIENLKYFFSKIDIDSYEVAKLLFNTLLYIINYIYNNKIFPESSPIILTSKALLQKVFYYKEF
jgi:hypothetical protein